MRVLLANEPILGRQVFAGVLRALRPEHEVITVEPEAVEEEAPRLHPDVVICSRATPTLRSAVGVWMEARLENRALLVRTSDAGASRDPDPGLDTLLAFVDRGSAASRGSAEVEHNLEAR